MKTIKRIEDTISYRYQDKDGKWGTALNNEFLMTKKLTSNQKMITAFVNSYNHLPNACEMTLLEFAKEFGLTNDIMKNNLDKLCKFEFFTCQPGEGQKFVFVVDEEKLKDYLAV